MIRSEAANQFYMKWKKLIHPVTHANRIHVDLHQLVEVMVVHHRVSACPDTSELHQIVDPSALLMMIAHLDLLALITSAKTLALALVAVSTTVFF